MQFHKHMLAALVCLIQLVSSHAWGKERDLTFKVGLPAYLDGSFYQQQIERYFIDLYKPTGKIIEFQYLPLNSQYEILMRQEMDAIAFMMEKPEQFEDNLVKVPESVTTLSLVAGCLTGNACDVNPQTRFVVVDDAQFATNVCKTKSLNCLYVNNVASARRALREGLADAHLIQHSPHIQEPCLSPEGIKIRPIANNNTHLFHYVDSQHKGLVETLQARIRHLNQQYKTVSDSDCIEIVLETSSIH